MSILVFYTNSLICPSTLIVINVLILVKTISALKLVLDFYIIYVSLSVAMTASISTSVLMSVGSVVKFSDIKFSSGVGDLSTFKSTGKFKCEKSGLYIVSVSIEMDYNGSQFHIFVNGKIFSKTSKYQQSSWWLSVSAVITIELNMNDTVWVQIGVVHANVRADSFSRFSIIKIH